MEKDLIEFNAGGSRCSTCNPLRLRINRMRKSTDEKQLDSLKAFDTLNTQDRAQFYKANAESFSDQLVVNLTTVLKGSNYTSMEHALVGNGKFMDETDLKKAYQAWGITTWARSECIDCKHHT